MSQQTKLRSFFDTLSIRHGHMAIATASLGALTDFLSPIGGWYVSTSLAALCATFLLVILANRNWVAEKIERSQFLNQWIGGSLPCNIAYLKAPAVQYLAIGLLVFGYASYVTEANADDGGALAANFAQISAFQSDMGILKKDLDAIKKDVASIKDTVDATGRTTRTIDENVAIIKERLEMGAEAERDPAKQLQKMGTSWDLDSFIKALDANDIKRLGLFMDGGFDYKSREASDRISSFFEPDKFASHLTALSYLRNRGVDFVAEFNPNWNNRDDGSSSPLGRAALNESEKAVQWLLEGTKATSLSNYKFVLFEVRGRIFENLQKAAKSGLDRYGSDDRAEQLATIDRNVKIITLLVTRGVDKSHRDYELYQGVLVDWLHLKYDHKEDEGADSGASYFSQRLNESDSLVLADRLKPLLQTLAPPSQVKKAALDKLVIDEYFGNFNRLEIEESENNLKALAEGRIAYLRSDAEKAAYKSEQENRIRGLKAQREAIRVGLKV